MSVLGVFLLTACTATQGSNWLKLEKKLNPERKDLWMVIGDKETFNFFEPIKRYGISKRGYGFGLIFSAEGFTQCGYPTITAFTPDQISLKKIDPKYHYLFVIPLSRIEKTLAEGKCVIVSGKVRINVAREVYDYTSSEWMVVSKTEGESYVTLIAAPNKKSLKKAVSRFFTLKEIPLEPIIFTAK